jgi:hypothetical protein
MKKKNESTVFVVMLQSSHSFSMKWNLYVSQKRLDFVDLQ